jgi:uncharacterized Tic20 family protein
VSAGLPGLGLGGLFFIVSALLAPFGQLWRSLRGRSRAGEWRVVGRQFAQALAMVIAIDLTLRLTYVALAAIGVGDVPSAVSGTVLPLTLIGITSALLLLVLVLAKLAELRLRLAGGGRPRIPQTLPRPHPARALAYGGAAAIAWVALLSAGAAELSPLSQPPQDQGPAARPEIAARSMSPPAESARDQQPQLETTTVNRAAPGTAGSGAGQAQAEGPAGGGGVRPSSPEPSVSNPAPATSGAPGGSPGRRPPQATSGAPPGVPGQTTPGPSGPPASAGPPEGSPAPKDAGPREGSPAPEHAGPPEGSPASERAGPGGH